MEYAVGLVATEVRSRSGIGQAYICTRVYQGRACGEPKQCALCEGTVCLASSENLRGVEREKVRGTDRQSADIPTVVRVNNCICSLCIVAVFALVRETILYAERAVSGGETKVVAVEIAGVVVETHRAIVVVLVEALDGVRHGKAMVHQHFVVGISSAYLEAVSITHIRVLG